MQLKKKIAIVFGAVSQDAPEDEKDVLREVETVSKALAAIGYAPVAVPVTLDLLALKNRLLAIDPYLVFNLVESIEGKGRYIHLVPVLLEELHLPYTGASLQALFLTSNKLAAKEIMRAAGIRTADWQLLNRDFQAETLFAPPYIVKSIWEHASIGLDEHVLFSSRESLSGYLDSIKGRRQEDCFIEAYIDGREFNLSVIETEAGPKVLPPAEIIFDNYAQDKPKIVGYKAKWEKDSFEFSHTPRSFTFPGSDSRLLAMLEEITLQCYAVFRLTGYSRVDFRVDHRGVPYVLEVNVNPGIAPDSGFTAAVEQSGITVTELVAQVVNCTLKRNNKQ